MGDRPSKKQRELLSFIDGFIKGYGYGPSYREVMRALNYKSVSTVAVHVDNLIAKGFLVKRDKSARSLEVVGQAESTVSTPSLHVPKTHEKWLIDQADGFIKTYQVEPTDEHRRRAETLVAALDVLGCSEAVISLRSKIDQ